jgi:hypothetical protein
MEARSERPRPLGRKAANVLATILLVAQCLAVAHYHPRQSNSLRCSAAASPSDGLCALCLFHQYSPTLSAAAPFPFSPTVSDDIELYAAQSWPLYAFNSYLPGRSPPPLA